MAEIKDFPDVGVGEEVGISIEYFGGESQDLPVPVLEVPFGRPLEPPTWGQIWFEVRWRLRADWENFKNWVRSKWR